VSRHNQSIDFIILFHYKTRHLAEMACSLPAGTGPPADPAAAVTCNNPAFFEIAASYGCFMNA
jgi:hypothetical protein